MNDQDLWDMLSQEMSSKPQPEQTPQEWLKEQQLKYGDDRVTHLLEVARTFDKLIVRCREEWDDDLEEVIESMLSGEIETIKN